MSAGESIPSVDEFRTRLNARFQGPLRAFFQRRIKDPVEAQDLTQEVLLRVIQAARSQHIDNAESFVFRVAVNLLRDVKRRDARNASHEFIPIDEAMEHELHAELQEGLSPERVVQGKDLYGDALRTLGELGELTRNIFVLFKVEKMKQKDIAALYGLGLSTVEKHVMKATLHLASRYGRQ